MMSRVKKGFVAGFAATVAVSVLEIINMVAGPWTVSFPRLLSVMLHTDSMAVGWAAHVITGTFILGGLFGMLCPRLPSTTPESKGIIFAIGAFVVMGLTVAPLAGVDALFLRAGFATLVWMVVTHVVYGIVLGNVYARLVAREKRAHAMIGAAPAH